MWGTVKKMSKFNIGDSIKVKVLDAGRLSYSGSTGVVVGRDPYHMSIKITKVIGNGFTKVGDVCYLHEDWLELDKNYIVSSILKDL